VRPATLRDARTAHWFEAAPRSGGSTRGVADEGGAARFLRSTTLGGGMGGVTAPNARVGAIS